MTEMKKTITFPLFFFMGIILFAGTLSNSQSYSEVSDVDTNNVNVHDSQDRYFTTFSEAENKKNVIIMYDESIRSADVGVLSDMTVDIKKQYHLIPGIAATITSEQLDELKLKENISGVFEDTKVTTFLDDSVSQINADQIIPSDGSQRGQGINVCILDTGIDDSHPNINQLFNEVDFVNNDPDAIDDRGHGTHVAGIVASTHLTFEGIAPGVTLMAAKVLDSNGSGYFSDVISGIEWCVDNDADIISMSLGGGLYSNVCDEQPSAIASNNAVKDGVVVIAASGNDSSSNQISQPACATDVIAVGAVNKSDDIASFSNKGHLVDVVAPGVSITSTVPTGICAHCDSSGFKTLSGTSMATPHVSGTVAILLQENPTMLPDDIRKTLQDTAVDLGESGFDNVFAHGRIDALAAFEIIQLPPSDCVPPVNGDWIVTSSCMMTNNVTVNNGNLIVQNNSVLTIPNGVTLDIDLVNYNLQVQQDSGILIESGGTIR